VLDGTPIRRLRPQVYVVKRPGHHIFDERLDARLPRELREALPTLVFPSIHRSEQNVRCLTVHPLGNPGPTADVGGRPETLVPTDPRRMTATLRALDEAGGPLGLRATFEATHHGPELDLPAYFVEIGFGDDPGPPPEAVRVLADVIPEVVPEAGDRVTVGVGGGHYAPHFTDLALKRRWAFGHLLSKHALETVRRPTVEAALARTPGADGAIFVRAADQELPEVSGVFPRLSESGAPRRGPSEGAVTPSGSPAAGT
jgi:D-aminoacyl-tRNA deacylase